MANISSKCNPHYLFENIIIKNNKITIKLTLKGSAGTLLSEWDL